MRILVLTWEYPPYVVGGMGKHVAGLIPALRDVRSRYTPLHVDVVTTDYAGGPAQESIGDTVTIHRVETPPADSNDLYNSVIRGNHALFEYARQLLESQEYELVHIHDWLTGVAGMRVKHEYKIPLVVTIHATERGRHQGYLPNSTSVQIDALEKEICHEAWRVIVCSHFMTNELNAYFGTPRDKIAVIANGISFNQLYPCPPAERMRLRAQYAPNNERLLFFVGRIVHEKGLHILIKAMPQILADFPTTRLLVAGKNGRHLWPLAAELRVDHAIDFLDFITDQQRDWLYQIVDAAIFPSLYEPFGIVALEAMALGCNVIASDVGGLGEVVKHQENGLTIYPNDPGSIAWATRQLFLEQTEAARRRRRALAEVERLYDWKRIAQETTTLYDCVIAERKLTVW